MAATALHNLNSTVQHSVCNGVGAFPALDQQELAMRGGFGKYLPASYQTIGLDLLQSFGSPLSPSPPAVNMPVHPLFPFSSLYCSIYAHLTVADVPDKELSRCVARYGPRLAALSRVDKVHHLGADDLTPVTHKSAPCTPSCDAHHLLGIRFGVFVRVWCNVYVERDW